MIACFDRLLPYCVSTVADGGGTKKTKATTTKRGQKGTAVSLSDPDHVLFQSHEVDFIVQFVIGGIIRFMVGIVESSHPSCGRLLDFN